MSAAHEMPAGAGSTVISTIRAVERHALAAAVVGVGDRIIGAGVGPASWNVGKTSAERDAPDGSGQVKLIKFY